MNSNKQAYIKKRSNTILEIIVPNCPKKKESKKRKGFHNISSFSPIIALSKPGMADNTNIGVIMSLLNESIAP